MKVGSILPKDDFCGTTFPTPKGGILTVVGDNGLKGNKKKYEFACSICSLDHRLPKTFFMPKNSFLEGYTSCGCSPRYRDDGIISVYFGDKIVTRHGNELTIVGHNGMKGNKKRYLVLCSTCSSKERYNTPFEIPLDAFRSGNRTPCECSNAMKKDEEQIVGDANSICNLCDYEFIRFDGDDITSKSKIIYICKKHGLQKQSLSKLKDGQRCPECSREQSTISLRKSNEVLVSELETKCLERGVKLVSVEDYKNKESTFKYSCNKHGIGVGIVASFIYNNAGCAECGKEKLVESRKIKDPYSLIIDKCVDLGIEFIGYEENLFISARDTNVIVKCKNHGIYSTNFSKLLNGNSNKCSSCAETGYSQSKPGTFYIIHYEYEGEVFLKYGITNRDTKIRSNEHTKGMQNVTSTILNEYYFEDGTIPFKMEQAVNTKYKGGVTTCLTSGNTETAPHYELDNVKLLAESVI